MSKPVSEAKLAANRDNSKKSTGPRTDEGKARSAQNSRKHGFNAAAYSAIRLEDMDALANLRHDAIAVYLPVNSQELFAVERIALAQLSILRVQALEAGLVTAAMNETVRPGGLPENIVNPALAGELPVAKAQNRSLCFAAGFERSVARFDSWKLFLRYQAQSERMYRRAVEEFERLKAQREELPNEATAETELLEPVDFGELLPAPDLEHWRSNATAWDPTRPLQSPIPPLPDGDNRR